jgi:hypothetical protein
MQYDPSIIDGTGKIPPVKKVVAHGGEDVRASLGTASLPSILRADWAILIDGIALAESASGDGGSDWPDAWLNAALITGNGPIADFNPFPARPSASSMR